MYMIHDMIGCMRYLLPITSLILLWTTLAYIDWGIVAWFALVPLLVFIINDKTTTKEACIWSGLVVGGYMFLTLWPLTSVNVWWWIDPSSITYQFKTLILITTITIGSIYGGFIPGALFGYLYRHNQNPVFMGVAWGALELLRQPLVYDFTWISLAYSQHNFESIVSLTPILSIAGLSSLIVLVNVLIAHSITTKQWLYIVSLCGIIVCLCIYNLIPQPTEAGEAVSVSALHLESRTQELYDYKEIDDVLSLLADELHNTPDILVTPENLFPALVVTNDVLTSDTPQHQTTSKILQSLITLSQRFPATHIVLGTHTRTPELRNSIVILKDGVFTDTYHKENLLIFGERPPLPLENGHIASFVPGNDPHINIGPYTSRPLICSEIATNFTVPERTDFIVNINNDSIFDSPLVGLQNLYVAQVQAAQHQRHVIRSGKGGVTAFISPEGRILTHRTTTGFITATINIH